MVYLQVYAAGCDIVILASDFQRVQIIPGVTHGNIKVSCIDCSTDTGKVNRLAPVLKTIFHQCVTISYTCSQSYFDGSVLK